MKSAFFVLPWLGLHRPSSFPGRIRPRLTACILSVEPRRVGLDIDEIDPQVLQRWIHSWRHQKHVRTTNLIERSFVEERRRTKTIPRFFNE